MTPTDVIPPLRRRLVVATDPATAFQLWTEDIGRWWPLEKFSVFGAKATVAFTDGVLVERSPDGDAAVWGTVLDWDPGSRLRMTWHPGRDPEPHTKIEVTFTAVAVQGRPTESTLVELVHSGWEVLDDPAAARSEYAGGWAGVIGRYGALADEPDRTWIVLRHRVVDPAIAGKVFGHPDFAEHLAFLGRLRDKGVLVAAGSLVPAGGSPDGSGMTVLRVPEDEVDAYLTLAVEDDGAVTSGLLAVDPVVWGVALTG
jgi:uncharacterized protein YndB with AHSA1/START domain/uncharacterized protein YciI